MKILVLIALFSSASLMGISQIQYNSYDLNPSETIFYRDTISNPNCIWQVGQPDKNTFSSAFSGNNVIITDTINPYPINDTSSFVIKHQVGGGYLMGGGASYVALSGRYKVNSDTLNDYGKIEFSPNNGVDWVLISDDTTSVNNWENWPRINSIITLTGETTEWNYFELTIVSN